MPPGWSRAVRECVLAPRPVQIARVLWCALILYIERLTFAWSVATCRLPASPGAFRVLVVSDPQVVGRATYADAPWLLQQAARFFSDQYLRKAWRALRGRAIGALAAPAADLVVLLGDLTDRGRWYTSEAAWRTLQQRWHRLLDGTAIVRGVRTIERRRDGQVPALVVPGNHDIGLPDAKDGRPTAQNAAAAAWFREAYAPHVDDAYTLANTTRASWNARIPIAVHGSTPTHELVLVNALELVSMQPLDSPPFGTDGERLAAAKARAPQTAAMIDRLGEEARGAARRPLRVLFSHVPLARDAGEHSCDVPWHTRIHGVRRESHRARVPGGDILQGGDAEHTYQNLVQPDVSAWVLRAVQPAAVFSGDDHDHCETVHRAWRTQTAQHGAARGFAPDDVPELTVKSVSMLEGVRRPGYAWLQLEVRDGAPSLDYTPCLLPDQVRLWLVYVPCFFATLWYVVRRCSAARGALLPSHTEEIPMEPLSVPRRAAPRPVASRVSRTMASIAVVPLAFWLLLQH